MRATKPAAWRSAWIVGLAILIQASGSHPAFAESLSSSECRRALRSIHLLSSEAGREAGLSFGNRYELYEKALSARYRIQAEDFIAMGSLGSVWRGRLPDAKLPLVGDHGFQPGQVIAIKRPRLGERGWVAYEAAMGQKVYRHDPSGIFVRSAFDPELKVLVMENLNHHQPLNVWLTSQKGKDATQEQIDFIESQLTAALALLRRAQVVHGDLKPDNILIDPETFLIKVIDMNLSAVLGEKPPHLKGARGGSVKYRSQNQANQGPAEYADDLHTIRLVIELLKKR